jgi:hypothetical protein
MRIGISSSGLITARTGPRRGTAILGAVALLAMLVFLMWMRIGFARYAFTAFLWDRSQGAVLNTRSTSDPTIGFAARDGSFHSFSEDYSRLCGRRSLCFPRTFTPAEAVPVVYDPAEPSRAYVRDFALYSTIFEWLVEAFFFLLIALVLSRLLSGQSGDLSIPIGPRSGVE